MIENNFNKLGLSAPLVQVLAKLGINEPTEIQSKTIPSALAGRDVMASAETGSGKTAAFLLPIIERLQQPGRLRALVLAPTRELAIQIEANAKNYSRQARLRSVVAVGGESLTKQIKALKSGVDILIATPGRLNDLIERGAVSLKTVETLVLDEADRMLDMGFLPQVRQIVRHVATQRQTLLLTATLSRGVEQLAREMMTDAVRIEAARSTSTVATLTQKAFQVLAHAKLPLLLALLKQHDEGSFVVFTQTRRSADRLSQALTANKHEVVTLHSDRSQSQRNRALTSFRNGRARVLVATDVAARGIDVDDIAFVVNYEVPPTADDYIHRVGRTARAGRNGSALTLVSPDEEFLLAAIERATGVRLERSKVAGFSDGRSEEQIKLASEIARLRSSSSRPSASRSSRSSRYSRVSR
ncbi:MAG: DEAD/DEAH box helicase [Acidobacteria bacterium]|nr:DEAD/DEAH box helicase [Acidobacteriota bacterium]